MDGCHHISGHCEPLVDNIQYTDVRRQIDFSAAGIATASQRPALVGV
jgi:hypothetical protein